ncbi:hypothetical protein JDW21_19545 [Bacillus subtilis]|uniref:hypothetical protein n=1 Tax=Bacillus subtilis TaxID=1423 RepID=UPI002ED1F246
MKIFDLFKKKKEIPMVQLEVVGDMKFDTEYDINNSYALNLYDRMNVSYNVHVLVFTRSEPETLTFELDGSFSIDYSCKYGDYLNQKEKRQEMHNDILKFFIANEKDGRVRKELEKDIVRELKRKIAENKIEDFKKIIDGKSFSINILFECNKDELDLK